MEFEKPFSAACERNRGPILAKLEGLLADCRDVLEIGSGTGQHAVHFAAAMPWLRWQCSDLHERLDGIRSWLAEAALPNLPAPIELDVDGAAEAVRQDALFTANTLHIMAWDTVARLFRQAPLWLQPAGRLIVYGPFHRDGRPTSAGNAAFDRALRVANPSSGIRDLAAVDALASGAGLHRTDTWSMPANNLLVVWRRD
ncbi:MAG: DUF938 domain-containing protein [Rhodocyclaceae bacterium]|nr:DUF938 domain-containing protein [Rhodocyclaceae bacterium]